MSGSKNGSLISRTVDDGRQACPRRERQKIQSGQPMEHCTEGFQRFVGAGGGGGFKRHTGGF